MPPAIRRSITAGSRSSSSAATAAKKRRSIEILRPAIPASVVALMARREGSGPRGDLLVNRNQRRADADEFDYAVGRQRSRQAFADAGAVLPLARQRRAPAAKARPRRRRFVAAEKRFHQRRQTRRAGTARLVARAGSGAVSSAAAPSFPSGTCRWRARPGGLRGSPRRRAIDRGGCRRRRTASARTPACNPCPSRRAP